MATVVSLEVTDVGVTVAVEPDLYVAVTVVVTDDPYGIVLLLVLPPTASEMDVTGLVSCLPDDTVLLLDLLPSPDAVIVHLIVLEVNSEVSVVPSEATDPVVITQL